MIGRDPYAEVERRPIDHALHLASLGFRVFRLKPSGTVKEKKEPLADGWQSEATSNPTQIKALWAMTPNAGVGLLMGDGLLGLDIDCKNGKDGLASLADYLRIDPLDVEPFLDDLGGYKAVTPTGGIHYIFNLGWSASNRTGLLGKESGVDLRGQGGYLCAPGTVIDGKS